MTTPRGRRRPGTIVALSVSFQRDSLLERGMGLEHLSELLTRIARPILRGGLTIACGGNWKPGDDNFTYLLLRLISSEQDDSSDSPDASAEMAPEIQPLINHLAWPRYLEVTPRTEAEWINSCRIVRITQEDAGIADVCPDGEASFGSDRALLNAAMTLGVARVRQADGMELQTVAGERAERLPAIACRILAGGKVAGSSGFAPGIFEEALLALERAAPLYVLGGFGGATAELAELLRTGVPGPAFDAEEVKRQSPAVARLDELFARAIMPAGVRGTKALLDGLVERAAVARSHGLAATLSTGLTEDETIELMDTSDIDQAVRLVLRGLRARALLATPPEA